MEWLFNTSAIDNLMHSTKNVSTQAAELDIFAWLLVLGIPILILVLVMKLLTKYRVLKNETLKWVVNLLHKKLVWNFVIRYTITAYLKFATEFVINLQIGAGPFLQPLKLILFLFCAVYPFHLLAALESNISVLHKPEVM